MRKVLMSSPVEYCQQGPDPVGSTARRVLVTGGAGYLGSTLVRLLLARRFRVRVLDALLFGDESLAPLWNHPGFELIKADVRDARDLAAAVEGCATVVHLAAIVGDRACATNVDLARGVNTAATRALLDQCRQGGVSRFLFASTCSVYGASESIVDEESATTPVSHYAETKVASEQLVLESGSAGFHPTVLRLGTMFGMSPRPRFDLVVNLLAAQAACRKRISICNGRQWRPFVHVADVARAFQLCMEADLSLVSGQILNVGDSRLNLQLSALPERIMRVVPSVQTLRIENQVDLRSYCPSFRKINKRLGFSSARNIEDGVSEIQTALQTGRVRDFTDRRYSNGLVLGPCGRAS